MAGIVVPAAFGRFGVDVIFVVVVVVVVVVVFCDFVVSASSEFPPPAPPPPPPFRNCNMNGLTFGTNCLL
jgi:hypothetical protein